MQLRNWGWDTFAEDSWQVTSTTTLNIGLRYEYTSPLYDLRNTNSNIISKDGVPEVFIGGEKGYPRGLMYSNKHNFAPAPLESLRTSPRWDWCCAPRMESFFTPVDMNTWCNQRHNVPYVFPENATG